MLLMRCRLVLMMKLVLLLLLLLMWRVVFVDKLVMIECAMVEVDVVAMIVGRQRRRQRRRRWR